MVPGEKRSSNKSNRVLYLYLVYFKQAKMGGICDQLKLNLQKYNEPIEMLHEVACAST